MINILVRGKIFFKRCTSVVMSFMDYCSEWSCR